MSYADVIQSSSRRFLALIERLQALGGWFLQPGPSYALISLLQLRTLWGIWRGKDLTFGDTSSYAVSAIQFFEHGICRNIHFSPLYTTFYGYIYTLTGDIVIATWLHRFIIAIVATLLVLTVMRKLLPPSYALGVAAWWAILPINYDTLYEVHLFAVIPILTAWWLTLSSTLPWSRGAALGILCLAALLMRNELALAAIIFAIFCLFWEWRRYPVLDRRWYHYLASYGLPFMGVIAVVLYYCCYVPPSFNLKEALRGKHTLNMSQVFSYGHLQRHPEVERFSPWTEYHGLMKRKFGKAKPSLREMLGTNPSATLEHFAWNVRLAPSGIQLLLFNAISGKETPDYMPVQSGNRYVAILSILCLLIWGTGLTLLFREREYWWHHYLKGREVGLAVMISTVSVSVPVILTQRPRPSYLFALSVFLMWLTAFALRAILRKLPGGKNCQFIPALGLILLIFFAPAKFANRELGNTTLRALYHQLKPYQPMLDSQNVVFLKGEYAGEIRNYIGCGKGVYYGYPVIDDVAHPAELPTRLDELGVNWIYLDERQIRRFEQDEADTALPFVDRAPPGWKLTGLSEVPNERWRLYRKREANPAHIAESAKRTKVE